LKIFKYIQYFLYIGINWGWKIASVIILQEIKGEKQYGINTTGADELSRLNKAGIDISHSTIYMPVSYSLIESALQKIKPGNRKHFLDIGCGKGRAMCVAANFGFNKLTGIDFSQAFCNSANENLTITSKKKASIQFNVICSDAAMTHIPADVDCVFLFNPFDEMIMKKVLRNILQSLRSSPRSLNIIYANPLYKSLFLEDGFKEVYYSKKQKQFEVTILTYRQGRDAGK
jgi:SAM-dependent methyltransferase